MKSIFPLLSSGRLSRSMKNSLNEYIVGQYMMQIVILVILTFVSGSRHATIPNFREM